MFRIGDTEGFNDTLPEDVDLFSNTSLAVYTGKPLRTKVIYCFISVFGLISNVLVIVIIALYPPMRKQLTNIFIVNQSSLDASAAVFLLLSVVIDTKYYKKTRGNPADVLACFVWETGLLQWSMFVASAYGIVAMTFEKFLAVVHPIMYRTKFARNKFAIGAILAAPWFIGTAINAGIEIPTTEINSRGACAVFSLWPSDSVENGIGVLTVIVEYFVPLFLLVFFYAKMTLVLHRRVEPTQETAKQGEAKRNETMARARTNVIKTLVLVGVLFIICWTLNIFNLLLSFLGYPYVNFDSDYYNFTVYLVFLNCCVNPIIYILKYKQFQVAVRYLCCRKRATEDSGTTQTEFQ